MESPVPPDYVFWYHNGKVINYDSPRGISVHTEKAQRTTSKLLISNAQPSDSGNYSCVPSNAEPAAIGLHKLSYRATTTTKNHYVVLNARRNKGTTVTEPTNELFTASVSSYTIYRKLYEARLYFKETDDLPPTHSRSQESPFDTMQTLSPDTGVPMTRNSV
ncbi:ig-like domain-containing protein [Trichonephila clavipes]|nr:ig-like domain-containing protein [Trichonephila clavipes]